MTPVEALGLLVIGAIFGFGSGCMFRDIQAERTARRIRQIEDDMAIERIRRDQGLE